MALVTKRNMICTFRRLIRGICVEDVIVLDFLSAMLLWTYVGVLNLYLWNDRYLVAFMQSVNWLALLIIFTAPRRHVLRVNKRATRRITKAPGIISINANAKNDVMTTA
jgi:hypothetical protein